MVILLTKNARRLLAALIIGGIIGGTAVTATTGARIDELTLENSELKQKLDGCTGELEELKSSLASKKEPAITTVEAVVNIEKAEKNSLPVDALELELARKVGELLNPLKGQEIKTLNPAILPEIVNHRVVTVDNVRYTLEVEVMVVTEKLWVMVTARAAR